MRLRWTVPARMDLRRIDAWLVMQATPEVAERTLSAIAERASFLVDFPRGGRPIGSLDCRVLRVHGTPYLIAYRIEGELVDVLRIVHEREDWRLPS